MAAAGAAAHGGAGQTSFTYQGRLQQGQVNVSANVDFQFSLWDGDAPGADQIGPTLHASDFPIEDGLFTVDLDFGPGAIAGAPRWLQIAVRSPHDPSDTGPFVTLSPRQPLMPAPQAMFAHSADGANITGLNASNITSGEVPASVLTGTYSLSGSFTGTFAGSGAGLTSLNASNISSGTLPNARLSGTYGSALTLSNAANSFTGTFSGMHSGSGAGLLDLNAANISTGNLAAARMPTGGSWSLSSPMNIHSGTLWIDPANTRVGVGTATPHNTLHVRKGSAGSITANVNSPLVVENSANAYINILSPSANEQGILFGYPGAPSGPATGGIIYNGSQTTNGLQFRTNGNINRMVITDAGNIGIGTTAPAYRLSIIDAGLGLDRPAANTLAFHTSTAERMRISSGGNVGIGTSSPSHRLHVTTDVALTHAVFGVNTAASGSSNGVVGISASTIGTGVFGQASSSTGTNYGVRGLTNSPDGYAGHFSGGRNYFQNNVGIGTSDPALRLSIGASGEGLDRPATNALGLYTAGAERVRINSGGNVGIGTTSPGARLQAYTENTLIAVYGTNLSETGSAYALYGLSTSASGHAVFASASSATGTTYGVRSSVASPDGYAGYFFGGRNYFSGRVGFGVLAPDSPIHAVSSSGRTAYIVNTATSGAHDGIEASVASAGSYALWGRNSAAGGYGVVGWGGSGGRGVLGSASGSGSFGVYATGNLGASGTKSFQIDHPLDPENAYLQHYCAEGPQPFNIYRGNVVLDGFGEAWVELPEYFDEINIDAHYQLTCIGSHAPVYIAQEVVNSTFQIAGGRPGMKVSWMVTAVRNDAYMRANPVMDVVPKPEHERGLYVQPELYGQPVERGINRPGLAAEPSQVSEEVH
jgi:hypothetical protein